MSAKRTDIYSDAFRRKFENYYNLEENERTEPFVDCEDENVPNFDNNIESSKETQYTPPEEENEGESFEADCEDDGDNNSNDDMQDAVQHGCEVDTKGSSVDTPNYYNSTVIAPPSYPQTAVPKKSSEGLTTAISPSRTRSPPRPRSDETEECTVLQKLEVLSREKVQWEAERMSLLTTIEELKKSINKQRLSQDELQKILKQLKHENIELKKAGDRILTSGTRSTELISPLKDREDKSELQKTYLHRPRPDTRQEQDIPNSSIRVGERLGLEAPPPPPPPAASVAVYLSLKEKNAEWNGPMHQFPAAALQSIAEEKGKIKPFRQASSTVSLTVEEMVQQRAESDALLRNMAREIDEYCKERKIISLRPDYSNLGLQEALVASVCRDVGITYIDREFLPVTSNLGLTSCKVRLRNEKDASDLKWRRNECVVGWYPFEEYTPPNRQIPQLISSAGINPSGLQVGKFLENKGVVAGLAALSEATGSIMSIFASTTPENEECGMVQVWVNKDGLWKLVPLDLYVPYVAVKKRETHFVEGDTEAGGAAGATNLVPYGCVSQLTFDMWPSLCEKAIAKIYGGYGAIPQLTCVDTVKCFTGGPSEVWKWWKSMPELALEELEAAVNTPDRGTGIALVTTHTAISLYHDKLTNGKRDELAPSTTSSSSDTDKGEGAYAVHCNAVNRLYVTERYRALKLEPDTTYRVLAVSQDEDSGAKILIRNWRKGAIEEEERIQKEKQREEIRGQLFGETAAKQRKGIPSPSRDEKDSADGHGDYIWLAFSKECLHLFDSLSVCFDCRRFFDVRVPVRFSGLQEGVCVPAHFLRVHLNKHTQPSHERRGPAKLWIGLQQPSGNKSEWGKDYLLGLKLTLVGLDKTPVAVASHQRNARKMLTPSYFVLSESYEGEFQYQSEIWMYMEFDPKDMEETVDGDMKDCDFFILPQLEVDHLLADECLSNQRGKSKGPPRDFCTAVVSILTEEERHFHVDLCISPPEMKAAMLHETVRWVDFDDCERLPTQPYYSEMATDEMGSVSARSRRSASNNALYQNYDSGDICSSHSGSASTGGCTSPFSPNSSSLHTQVNGKWFNGFVW